MDIRRKREIFIFYRKCFSGPNIFRDILFIAVIAFFLVPIRRREDALQNRRISSINDARRAKMNMTVSDLLGSSVPLGYDRSRPPIP